MNKHVPKISGEQDSQTARRRAYHFKLRDGNAGVYISEAATVQAARRELARVYGDRLAAVGEG